MLHIWWSVFLVPVLMLSYGVLARVLPLKRIYPGPRPLPPEQQRFADRLLLRSLWRFALALAVLAFLVMQTVRLLPLSTQRIITYAVIILEVLAVTGIVFPIERALEEQFGEFFQPATVIERAPAKVNLLLAVGRPRSDGYHELVSVMQTVNVSDELTLRATDSDIQLTCDREDLPADDTNLCYKAAVKFFDYTGISGGVSIELKKTIPMQAGLGGGSADAAAVLRGLRRLYDPALSDGELEAMAAELGSDVPFCVRGGTALVQGRGERLEPVAAPASCWLVLVKPAFSCSTGKMYDLIDRQGCYDDGKEQASAMTAALKRGDLAGVCGAMGNTFEWVISPECETHAIRERLRQLGALGALLCGSGSAVFGVFDREETARMAAAALRGTYPETFCGKCE